MFVEILAALISLRILFTSDDSITFLRTHQARFTTHQIRHLLRVYPTLMIFFWISCIPFTPARSQPHPTLNTHATTSRAQNFGTGIQHKTDRFSYYIYPPSLVNHPHPSNFVSSDLPAVFLQLCAALLEATVSFYARRTASVKSHPFA